MKPFEVLLILYRQNKSHGDIYKKERGLRQIYVGLGSRECQLMRKISYQSDSPPLNCITYVGIYDMALKFQENKKKMFSAFLSR